MLTQMLAHVPAHYLRMTQQLLRMLEQGMRGVPEVAGLIGPGGVLHG